MPNTEELLNDISALKDLLLLESHRVQEANSRAEAEAQRAEAEAQRAEAEAQRAEVEAQKVVAEQRKNQSLLEIIEGLERQLFGRKTERLCAPNENQMRLFDFGTDELSPEENANDDDESNDSGDSSNEQKKKRKKRGRKKGAPGRQGFPAHFPRIDVTATDSGPTTCPCCDENLTHIGFDVSERLETIPAKFVVLRIKRAKRVCKNCPKQGVITQPAPPFSQERSKYADGLIALVLVDKFADHLPLRRQIKRFKRDGVHIPISNLCRMVQKSADLLKHVVKIMYQELLAGDFIQGDETGIPILHGRKNVPKKGVLWVYTNGDHAVFSVTRDKNGVRPETFLQGRYYSKPVDRFKGVFLPDGASVFNTACAIEDVIRAGCWFHARRKFFEARNDDPRGMVGLIEIRKLAMKERAAWLVSEAERAHIRNTFGREWTEKFKKWVDTELPKTVPKSRIHKALQYIQNQWEYLTAFLDHPNIPIHNNTSERSLRGPVVGRKNWMFAGSETGAEAAAIHYSIVTSCMMVGVDPREYLRDVLPRLPYATPKVLRMLTPKAWAERHRDG